MKIGTYYQDEDEGTLYPTGETTSISAADAVEVVEDLVSCLLGGCGSYEDADYDGAYHVLRAAGVIVEGSDEDEAEALADHEGRDYES